MFIQFLFSLYNNYHQTHNHLKHKQMLQYLQHKLTIRTLYKMHEYANVTKYIFITKQYNQMLKFPRHRLTLFEQHPQYMVIKRKKFDLYNNYHQIHNHIHSKKNATISPT